MTSSPYPSSLEPYGSGDGIDPQAGATQDGYAAASAQGQPYQGQPYQQPYQGQAYQGQPYQQPYQGAFVQPGIGPVAAHKSKLAAGLLACWRSSSAPWASTTSTSGAPAAAPPSC